MKNVLDDLDPVTRERVESGEWAICRLSDLPPLPRVPRRKRLREHPIDRRARRRVEDRARRASR